MSDYKRIINSPTDIEILFSVVEKFYANNAYGVVRNDFPEKIEFRKKGRFFAVHDINTTYILIVKFSYLNDSTLVELTYTFPQCAGSLSSKSVHYLNEEVDNLTAKIHLAHQKYERELRINPGKKKRVFSFCPFCGKGLDLPKTPAFCPYCEGSFQF